MSVKPIEERYALGNELDLTVPTSTQGYPLGMIYECEDSSTKTIKKFMYIYGGGGLTAYVPYAISFASTSAQEITAITPASFASPGSLICIPQVAFTSGYYGFVQIQGNCTAACGTVTATYNLICVTPYVTLTYASGTTTTSTNTVGFMVDNTVAATSSIYLIGSRIVIA